MSFDKFEWMRVVAADARPTDGEKFILWNIAFVSVRSGEDTFCVRHTTIAERWPTSVKTLKRAKSTARSLGYIQIAQARQRGRGHHRADEYRLTMVSSVGEQTGRQRTVVVRGERAEDYIPLTTEIGDSLTPINEEIGDTDDR